MIEYKSIDITNVVIVNMNNIAITLSHCIIIYSFIYLNTSVLHDYLQHKLLIGIFIFLTE